MSASKICVAVLVALCLGLASAQQNQLETPRVVERDQRREFITANGPTTFKFNFATVAAPSKVDNAAVTQLQMDKLNNQFLSTLPGPGSAQFMTVLKPCGILLPHVHQRATELYTILSGKMAVGISQENGGAQNITFDVNPGEVFIVPQGLLHYNHNAGCSPLVFLQSFNSADPGALNVIGALASLGASGPAGAAAIKASNSDTIKGSPQGAFALDTACLATCGLPATGGGLTGLPTEFAGIFSPA